MRVNSVAALDFDGMYLADPDPWQVTTSDYERRKNEVLLASLPFRHYALVWEPGCGVGVLSRELAARADRVVASEASHVAARLAAERCADLTRVSVHHTALPDVPPLPGPVDLVLAAEFLYYLPDLATSLEALWSQLRAGGHLATIHWRHDADDLTRSGARLHADLVEDSSRRGADHLVHHDDQHFVLDIFGTRP